jgi:hypothetical protein
MSVGAYFVWRRLIGWHGGMKAAGAFMGLPRELRTRHNMRAIYCENRNGATLQTLISGPRGHSRSSPNARLLLVDPGLGEAARHKNKWKSTSHCSLSASLSAWPLALAFGMPYRVIAERVHADEGDIQKYKRGRRGTTAAPDKRRPV